METVNFTSLIAILSLISSISFAQTLELNPNFGENGHIDYQQETFSVHTIDTLRDGKIVLGGRHGLSDQTQFMFKRLLKDGSPDPSFGLNGLKLIPYPAAKAYIFGMRVLDNDHIIATGSLFDYSEDTFKSVIFKIDESGQLDFNFGDDGFLIFPKSPTILDEYIIPLEGDEIIVGMNYEEEEHESISFYRINGQGEILQNFGENGRQLFGPDLKTKITKARLGPDNKFVVAGILETQARTFVARFHLDGSLDSSFYSIGYRLLDAQIQNIEDLKVEADGALLLSHYRIVFNAAKAYLHRLLPNGVDDINFGLDGRVDLEGLTHCEKILGSIIREQGNVLTFGLFPNENQGEEAIVGHGMDGNINMPSLSLNIGAPILIFRSLLAGSGVFLGYYDNEQVFHLLHYIPARITNTKTPTDSASKIEVFPTMFSSHLFLKGQVPTHGPITAQIINATGQLVKEVKLENGMLNEVQSINLGWIPSGSYFVHISPTVGMPQTTKVIKVYD
ncbi:MAG: T9SS type A sorting domain-containing protein [Saprospiraceae bacterium]|nr:T9SS type A sorting domain-containing protein [Saprospiraceae bacterium]